MFSFCMKYHNVVLPVFPLKMQINISDGFKVRICIRTAYVFAQECPAPSRNIVQDQYVLLYDLVLAVTGLSRRYLGDRYVRFFTTGTLHIALWFTVYTLHTRGLRLLQ